MLIKTTEIQDIETTLLDTIEAIARHHSTRAVGKVQDIYCRWEATIGDCTIIYRDGDVAVASGVSAVQRYSDTWATVRVVDAAASNGWTHARISRVHVRGRFLHVLWLADPEYWCGPDAAQVDAVEAAWQGPVIHYISCDNGRARTPWTGVRATRLVAEMVEAA